MTDDVNTREEITGTHHEVPTSPLDLLAAIPDRLDEFGEDLKALGRKASSIARDFRIATQVFHSHGGEIERHEKEIHKLQLDVNHLLAQAGGE